MIGTLSLVHASGGDSYVNFILEVDDERVKASMAPRNTRASPASNGSGIRTTSFTATPTFGRLNAHA